MVAISKSPIAAFLLISLAVLVNCHAISQQPVTLKIAVINLQGCVAQSNDGQVALKALQQQFEPKQAELKALSDEIEKMKAQLQAQDLSTQERSSLESRLAAKQSDVRSQVEAAQKSYQDALQNIYTPLVNKVAAIAVNYARSNGINVLLDTSVGEQSLLWMPPSYDISKTVMDIYNGTHAYTASSQTTTITVPAKIALINFKQAVTATSEYKNAAAELQRKLAASSDPKANEKYNMDLQRLYSDVGTKLYKSASAFVASHGYTILFDTSSDTLIGALWHAPEINLDALITEGNCGFGTDIMLEVEKAYSPDFKVADLPGSHHVMPPPRPAGSEPSLSETLKFIQEKLSGFGKLNFVAFYQNTSDGSTGSNIYTSEISNVTAYPGQCYLTYHWKVTRDGVATVDADRGIPLHNVLNIVAKPLAQYQSEANATIGIPNVIITSTNPSVTALQVRGPNGELGMFPFADADLADRLAKALTHAIELSGGGNKEPF